MDNYAVRRITELQRAVETLRVSVALIKPSTYTIDWIRDQLEADASFSAWIINMLETTPSFYTWIVSALESDASFSAWIVNMLQTNTGFYTWFRNALNADSTFISSLITSFESNLGFNNWLLSTATYSTESFLTLTRTATLSLTGGVVTNITWQTMTRTSNNGTIFQNPFSITLPTATITIPQSGYYLYSFIAFSDVAATKRFFITVNGNTTSLNVNDTQASSRYLYFNAMQYFNTGDTIAIGINPSVTIILSVTGENLTQQSPWFHISKVNAAG